MKYLYNYNLSTFTLEETTLLLFDVFLGVFLGLSMFIYFCYAGRITLWFAIDFDYRHATLSNF